MKCLMPLGAILILVGCSSPTSSTPSVQVSNISTTFSAGMYTNTLYLNASESAPGYQTINESFSDVETVNVLPDGTIPVTTNSATTYTSWSVSGTGSSPQVNSTGTITLNGSPFTFSKQVNLQKSGVNLYAVLQASATGLDNGVKVLLTYSGSGILYKQ